MTEPAPTQPVVVCALYHFVSLDDFAELRQPLLALMQAHGLRGTLLLAHEGINGTVAGSRAGIDALLAFLAADDRFEGLQAKESYDDETPFYRAKVKLKKEIVTMGVTDLDPRVDKGEYVSPADWNALISDPDVTVIDTRNAYEVAIGTFKGAINPNTTTFREFPDYAAKHLDKSRHKKVAMFCTGGIRCEKSTAYLKSQGFDEVYHLEGGILKYLETVPEGESLWQGECFVFDNRVTVNHQLEKGQYDQCHACRMPISAEDKQHPAFSPGISCPHCIAQVDEQRRQRFAERQHQLELARSRGDAHIGEDAIAAQRRNREAKQAQREQQRKRQKS